MIPVHNYTVNLDPTSSTVTISPPFPEGGVIVTTPLALFTFALGSEALELGATFLTYPMQWFTPPAEPGGAPTPDNPPPDFKVQWYSTNYFAVWDYNSSQNTTQHTFYIIVQQGPNIYWGDPMIINEPPVSG